MTCGCGERVRLEPRDALGRVAIVMCRTCFDANLAEKRRRVARTDGVNMRALGLVGKPSRRPLATPPPVKARIYPKAPVTARALTEADYAALIGGESHG